MNGNMSRMLWNWQRLFEATSGEKQKAKQQTSNTFSKGHEHKTSVRIVCSSKNVAGQQVGNKPIINKRFNILFIELYNEISSISLVKMNPNYSHSILNEISLFKMRQDWKTHGVCLPNVL
jgi:hypothetical protein